MKRTLLHIAFSLALLACLMPASVLAQGVTTAAMSGTVVDANGNGLEGATVIALHTPTGTKYGVIAREGGRFNLANLRVGGPYTVTASYVGYRTGGEEGFFLNLGQARRVLITLEEEGVQAEEVLITSSRSDIIAADRNGTSTNITGQTINELPTISRNLNDFTRLTPQSSGTSFAGRDNRFNNYSIDGNIYNNNFGLGSSQFAGGNPLSLDAIEEVQVNLAPYDVRQGGFSGASVNAVTRSGSNQFSASAYAYYRNQSFVGTQIGDNELTAADAFTRIIGARAGGAIVKDRIFYFISVEQEEATNPGIQKVAARPGLTPDGLTVSRVPAEELDFVREQMAALYDYETGPYEDYPFANRGLRINARLDFNLNESNRLMVRFNRYSAFSDVTVNGNSLRYNPSALRYRNTNRFGIEAMNFRNSHYSVDNNVTSVVAELNSVIGTNMANNLRIGFNSIDDPIRSVPGGQDFPFIEVLEFDGTTPQYYMTLGNELFTVGNLLSNQVFNVTNNFSYFAGNHNITAGINFELMSFSNAFNPAINGVYRYNSYDDFVASVINQDPNVKPALFLQGYSFRSRDDIPTDDTRFGQIGVYVQDDIEVASNFNLSLGFRVDLPFYPIDLPTNPRLDALNLSFTNPRTDETLPLDVSVLPGVRPLWQPRVGFNWDVFDNDQTQIRGGSGMFSGRIPFVWISNQVNGNGVTRGGFGLTPDDWGQNGNPAWQGFQSDVAFYRPDPATAEPQLSNSYAVTDPNLRLPQVWRSNLALDQKLPGDFIFTLEGIYSLDINSPLAVNINADQAAAQRANIKEGVSYPYWPSRDDYYVNDDLRDIILLTNINRGYYASLTAQLQKSFSNGLSASLSYVRSVSKDYGLEGGSQAASLWPFVVAEDRNDPEIGFSRFDQPHRVVGYVTFTTKEWVPRAPTTISLFYDGGTQGRFSYTYSGSFGDGADRLMYIPTSFDDANLIDKDNATAQQQWDALNAYIEGDSYLSANRGEIAERNGAKFPWLSRFDLRLVQDVNFTSMPDGHRLQLTLDVLNFGNLINNEWGVGSTFVQRNLMNFEGVDANGQAQFTVNTVAGTTALPTETYRPIIDLSQTWSAQIGVRYLFH